MYCSKCGQYSNENRAVFCPLCGEKIVAVTEDKIKTLELQKNDPSLYSGYSTVSEENTSQDSFTESSASSVDSSAGVLPLAKQLIGKANKKYLTIGALAVVVIAVISVFSYLNSAAYLEKKLAKDFWFSSPYSEYGIQHGMGVRFYSDGNSEMREVRAASDGSWYTCDSSDYEWEIMDDKTLRIDRTYFEWGNDWRLSGNTLYIENAGLLMAGRTYHSNAKWDYCDELIESF